MCISKKVGTQSSHNKIPFLQVPILGHTQEKELPKTANVVSGKGQYKIQRAIHRK